MSSSQSSQRSPPLPYFFSSFIFLLCYLFSLPDQNNNDNKYINKHTTLCLSHQSRISYLSLSHPFQKY